MNKFNWKEEFDKSKKTNLKIGQDTSSKGRCVRYPSIYKHFKDKYYTTMGISIPINEEELIGLWAVNKSETALHTENKEHILIVYNEVKRIFVHNCKESKDVLVVYRPLYLSDETFFARPIKMFLSEVNKEKYPNTKQKYRFE